jgi:phosphate transport system protein
MSRDHFHEQLGHGKALVLKMGDEVYSLLSQAIQALVSQDHNKAQAIERREGLLDEIELEIEHLCLKLLALQQPVAIDLRYLAAIMKISADLERIGDHIHKIASKTVDMSSEKYVIPLEKIPQMGEVLLEMTKSVLNAFINVDPAKAREVIIQDQKVDQLENEINQSMLNLMTTKNDKTTINQAVQFLFICRYLERIGDHLSNVAERIMYIATGEVVAHFLEKK